MNQELENTKMIQENGDNINWKAFKKTCIVWGIGIMIISLIILSIFLWGEIVILLLISGLFTMFVSLWFVEGIHETYKYYKD